jgi:hypothetical protein
VTVAIFYIAARDTIREFINKSGVAGIFTLALLGVTAQIWPLHSNVSRFYN